MKETIFTVKENVRLAGSVYKMTLSGETDAITNPGQFVNIKLDELYLRRPISVCDVDENTLTLVYRAVGKGTDAMAKMRQGDSFDALTGLGNGFNLDKCGNEPLLVGGGVGIPPLYLLAKRLIEKGVMPKVILGFNKAEEIFLADDFAALGAELYIATADGSVGTKGFVTDVMKNLSYSYFYSCGPMPMYRAMEKVAVTDGEYSLEERMGCGFGACMGCSCKTTLGNKRICADGPVFGRSEIIWQTQE